MRKQFQSWSYWQRALLIGALALFWLSGAIQSYKIGNTVNLPTDGTTEGMALHAVEHYLKDGFFKNYLLPTYPAFGHDPSGKLRTEPFVYNHYLAGADLTLAFFVKVLGMNAIWAGRLIPHTLTVGALAFLVIQIGVLLQSASVALIALAALLIPRAITAWSICLWGHSYVMAFYLFLIGAILWIVNQRHRAEQLPKRALILGLGFGLAQSFYEIDWLALTFLSTISVLLLFWESLDKKVTRNLLLGMIAGGVVAITYQITVSSLHFGSLTWVIDNIRDWVLFRTGDKTIAVFPSGDYRLHKVLREYNHQAYGATGFTAYNEMLLAAGFIFLGFAGKLISSAKAWRSLLAVLVSYLAMSIWVIVMRQHAVAHTHFLPRHSIAVYMTFLLIVLQISVGLVRRSRKVLESPVC